MQQSAFDKLQYMNYGKYMNTRKILLPVFFIFLCSFLHSAPIYSPSWGFSIDLPVSYVFIGGNGLDRFSFANPDGANFDLVVYHAGDGRPQPSASLRELVQDVQRRLNNRGDVDSFRFRGREAFVIELNFPLAGAGGRTAAMTGWAIALELGYAPPGGPRPMLLALAYGPAEKADLLVFHLSALNSIAPEEGDRLAPGPISEFLYPRQTRISVPVFGMGIEAEIFAEDAEAAQALVDREFMLLYRYADAPNWQEAWQRFYRAIHRDSYCRLADLAFHVERKLNLPATDDRDFAEQLLRWVQTFKYERDLEGSDFVNLVSAATEGRGDCDSRAMLWALILRKANIPSGIMVSRHFGHAMGLAEVPGAGARFEVNGQRFLVAETTADVGIGLIDQEKSGVEHWLGIVFE